MEANPYRWCFHTNGPALLLDRTAVTSVPLLFHNDSQEADEKSALRAVCFSSSFISNSEAPGFLTWAKESTSLGCTTESLQDKGDRNVKQPAPAFTTPSLLPPLHPQARSPQPHLFFRQKQKGKKALQHQIKEARDVMVHNTNTPRTVLAHAPCVPIHRSVSSQGSVLFTRCWNN